MTAGEIPGKVKVLKGGICTSAGGHRSDSPRRKYNV